MFRGDSATAGSTLVEVMVALSLIAVVGAALASFLVASIRTLRYQVDRQTAGQLAADAWERVAAIQMTPGAAPTLPAATTTTINGIAYTVTWQDTPCVRDSATTSTGCTAWSASNVLAGSEVKYYRVRITVRWAANTCPAGSCTYETAALINTDDDPTFEGR
ncbi:MAG TPA: hypothetical protein VFO77_02810 [Actinoplanes sp.]|nr:hypothetical protein [Actinoplanes sp.]